MNTELERFKQEIWQYYTHNGRLFDWRHCEDPYQIIVSEVMLQQTQTQRVAQKFPAFINAFPTFNSLARASLAEVLLHWQGLGYNRRGKYLYQLAQIIAQEYHGTLPADPELLQTLPGIGYATARSVCAFAFNKPTVFIETNIRSVFIFFFFQNKTNVTDKEILPLVRETLDHENPRDWYYALMDYGVMLKKQSSNPNRKSAHYSKQSKFEGSDRQIRGMIIKLLTRDRCLDFEQLCDKIPKEMERIKKILDQLQSEKMITLTNAGYSIA